MIFRRGMFDRVSGSEFEMTSSSMEEAVTMGKQFRRLCSCPESRRWLSPGWGREGGEVDRLEIFGGQRAIAVC